MEGHHEKILSIIIPSTHRDRVQYLINQIYENVNKGVEIIVVLNSEHERERRIWRGHDGNLTIIMIPRRIGFVPSIIIGSMYARGRYLMFLNDDCKISTRALEMAINFFSSYHGYPLILTCAQTAHVACSQKVLPVLQLLNRLCFKLENEISLTNPVFIPTDFIQGACYIVERGFFKKILPTPHLYLYDDDIEVSLKATRAGIKKALLMPPICVHLLTREELRNRYCRDYYTYFKLRNDVILLLKFSRGLRLVPVFFMWILTMTFIIIFVWSTMGRCTKNARLILKLPRIISVGIRTYKKIYSVGHRS